MSPRLNPATRAALTSGRLAHLVTLDPDNSPQVSCVYVGLDGDDIVCGHLGEYRKIKNVRRDGRVAVSMEADIEGFPGYAPYLVVNGTARVIEGGAPELLRRITSDYFGAENAFPPPGAPEGYVIRITPERVHGTGPWNDDSDH